MTSDPFSNNPGVCAAAKCWCTVENPHTPPAPVDSSIRPGAGAATTPRVEAIPQPPRGVLNGDVTVRGGEAATAASLDKQRQQWGPWQRGDDYTLVSDIAQVADWLNFSERTQAAIRVECGVAILYVRWSH